MLADHLAVTLAADHLVAVGFRFLGNGQRSHVRATLAGELGERSPARADVKHGPYGAEWQTR